VKLSQTRLLVDDLGVCFRFYREILGLLELFQEIPMEHE
jgi:catechol 2,3-dioxygenase-like lactoylglutathione lyase family enzyme